MTTNPSTQRTVLAVRTDPGNANHHLWNNNGTWWCHFTIHLPDYTKRRIRQSLHTPDVRIARVLRDTLLHEAGQRGPHAAKPHFHSPDSVPNFPTVSSKT